MSFEIQLSLLLFWFIDRKIRFVKVGDLGYASELGNYAEYSGAPNEEEVLQYARVVIDVSIVYYQVTCDQHNYHIEYKS